MLVGKTTILIFVEELRIEIARPGNLALLNITIIVTKLRHYNVYILPVLLYDTWSVTEASRQRVDAFDQWCLRRILRVPCTAHVRY